MKIELERALREQVEKSNADVDPTFAQMLRKGLLDSGAAVLRFTDATGREYFCAVATTQAQMTECNAFLVGAQVLERILNDHVPNGEFCSRPQVERA